MNSGEGREGKEEEENRGEGIWYVLKMAKDQCVYKAISNQMKGTKFSWRGMPKSAYTGYCLVFDGERRRTMTAVLRKGNIMIQI